ncbi:hypothetical protein [Aureimonas sp. SA4125]|nr:hypothetical protein [Aureimonas sp. SA4125]
MSPSALTITILPRETGTDARRRLGADVAQPCRVARGLSTGGRRSML